MTLGLDLQVSQEVAGAEPKNLHKVYKSTNTHMQRTSRATIIDCKLLDDRCGLQQSNNENNWLTAQQEF